jgi:putative flippase GtrA
MGGADIGSQSGDTRLALAATLLRFLLVGLANTAVGFGVIMGLQFGLGVGPHLANAGGYAIGLALSFTLNRRFVFASRARPRATAARFAVAALGAFLLNQAALFAAGRLFGPGGAAPVLSQAFAAATYTGVFFLLCRGWVFASSAPLPAVSDT